MIWRIYKYTNIITGQSYIGQTSMNVNDRAKKGKWYHGPFREAIDEYGWDKFEQSILRLCTTQEEADQYERYFIEKYNTIFPNGYNMESGGNRRKTVHNLTRKRIAKKLKGIVYSEERNRKISKSLSGENHPMYNKHHTEETKQKISISKKGQPCPTKGRKWFNNGIKNILSYECPEGYVPGMLHYV